MYHRGYQSILGHEPARAGVEETVCDRYVANESHTHDSAEQLLEKGGTELDGTEAKRRRCCRVRQTPVSFSATYTDYSALSD